MSQSGTLRCRSAAIIGLTLALSLVAGCSTVSRTLDFSSDPNLQQGGFPNINEAGKQPVGKALTPEQQEQAKAALEAKAKQTSAAVGASARPQSAASAQGLENLAKTHGEKTIQEIQSGCDSGTAADATKCPQ